MSHVEPVAAAATAADQRAIATRTPGHIPGPVTRLISRGGLGKLVKPFVFLDRIDTEAPNGSLRRRIDPWSVDMRTKAFVAWIGVVKKLREAP